MTGENTRINLTGDWEVKSLNIKDVYNRGDTQFLIISGTLTVGSGGIIAGRERGAGIGNGKLTSATGMLNIKSTVDTGHYIYISSTIVDHRDHKVGLRVFRDAPGNGPRGVTLGGDEANTYTGDTEVVGNESLVLIKKSNVTAVAGNLNLRDGARVHILRSEQIANKSRVLLHSKGGQASTIMFSSGHGENTITETIAKLTVDGSGMINFHGEGKRVGQRFLFLDDLDITTGSSLAVRNWIYGSDFLLVRKDSKTVKNVLKSIHFEGKPDHTELVDYNKDYWQIAHTPEPAVYGAMLATAGLGVVLFRRRKRRLVRGHSQAALRGQRRSLTADPRS